jgi:hypothetical protein
MAQKTFDRAKVKVKGWEDRLTPLEIAKLLEGDGDLPFKIAPLLKNGQRPAAYIREAWSEEATYFAGRSDTTRLLVIFSAPRARLGIPISYVLQALRDDVYDVLLLRDPNDEHYTRGVQGLGSFLDTTRRIEDFAGTKGLQQIITYGASLGGLPALRAGLLLKASRAISVGGRYPWHAGRLARAERLVDAFDLLCPCAPPSPTQLIMVYARHDEVDEHAFDLVQKTFPACIGVPIDTAKHNLVGYFYKADLLPQFLACLFEHWDTVEIRTDLLKRLDQAARQSQIVQSPQAAHATRKVPSADRNRLTQQVGEWLRATPLWPLTWPARALRRTLRSVGPWSRNRP